MKNFGVSVTLVGTSKPVFLGLIAGFTEADAAAELGIVLSNGMGVLPCGAVVRLTEAKALNRASFGDELEALKRSLGRVCQEV